MRLAAAETFRNLKLAQYKKQGVSSEMQFITPKQYTTLPVMAEAKSGLLAPKRVNQVDLFKKYTYQVIPILESSVEFDLLDRIFKKVDPQVKESIIQSYVRKQVQQHQITPDASKILGFIEEVTSSAPREKAKIYMENGIQDMQQDQIGTWAPFSYEDFKKVFKHSSPGDFLNNFLKYTRNFSLLITDEGFKTCDFVSLSIRDEDLPNEIKDADLDDPAIFIRIFNLLKGDFQEALKKYRKDSDFERIFSTSVIFDSLLAVIIKELSFADEFKTQKGREQFFQQLVEEIKLKYDPQQPNANLVQLFFKTVKQLSIGNRTIDLLKYVDDPFPVQSDLKERFPNYYGYGSNLLFYGDQGSGKSGILMQAIMYAQKRGYIVVVVPSGYKWTQESTPLERHHEVGLVMQPKFAVEWLEQFKQANEELLKQLKVDLNIYGKYGLSGQHDDEPEAVPNIYDERRQYYFKDYEQFLFPEEKERIIGDNQKMSVRVTIKLPAPKSVLELVDFGINNMFYSTNVIYEVLEQIYNQTQIRVLVAVDGLNWFYRPSAYPSFRYASDKSLRGHMPPCHLSLCRAFMHLDGHKIKNGMKIAASTIYKLHLHTFEPRHIYVPNEYGVKVEGLPLDHFRSFCEYSLQTGLWRSDNYGMNTQEQFWMETQGNISQAIKCMREHWRDV